MALRLEAFDPAPPGEPAPGPTPDWLAGHAAGLEDGRLLGRAEAEASSAHLSAELSRRLQDMAFGYAEARGQVLGSLRTLLGRVADALLPTLAAEALGPWLAETLMTAARADSATPFVVSVHPDRVEAVAACLPRGLPAVLRADPALGPLEAHLTRAGEESELDLAACLAALREAISTLNDDTPAARKASHG